MLLLGDQLIRDAGIAVFELVKNAYDADATNCEVSLVCIDEETNDSMIIVEDDGHGMDIKTVRNVWLEPGTENRKKQRTAGIRSEKFHRLPLGEKGVGRFAVHKLGQRVSMITRSKNSKEVVVSIDWNDFDQDQYLNEIPVKVTQREPKTFTGRKTGTRLEVSSLNEMPWTRRRVRSLQRSITSICSSTKGPDSFNPSLTLDAHLNWLDGLLKPEEVSKQAIFVFDGKIKNSTLTYNYRFRPRTKLDRVKPRSERNKKVEINAETTNDNTGRKTHELVNFDHHDIGVVRLQFKIFDRDPKVLELTSTDVAGLKSFLNNNGGVLVYRDGVRVYDYGEPGNDWLDLGGRRVNVPSKRIGNNQILGTVELSLEESQGLVEKTNREGFVENDAYIAFQAAITFAIKQAEVERNFDKSRIRKAYSKAKNKAPVLDELSQLRDEFKNRDLEKELGSYLNRIETQYRDVLDRMLVSASAGLNLSVVLHEVEKRISDLLLGFEAEERQESLLERAKTLADMVDGLTWLTRTSGPTVVKASTLIEQAMLNWKFRFRHHEVKVVNGIASEGDPDFSVKVTRRLVMGAFMNLIDNSIYWLGTCSKERKIYLGTTFELNDKPGLVIADNGPGFLDPADYLVEPYVTRKPDGMGLGLHIAHEVMKQQKGQLVFLSEGDITLPSEFTGAALFLEFEKEV
jgi:signal transduction histidine kinase